MRTEQISNTYEYVVNTDSVANAATPFATLTVPAGRVYRVKDGTPLMLKLFDSTGTEFTGAANVWMSWKAPVGQTVYQAGATMNYGIFARISASDQENINYQGRRLITFDSDELARAATPGAESIITGLTADYQILLYVQGPSAVDVTQSNYAFNFSAEVLSNQEYLKGSGNKGSIVSG